MLAARVTTAMLVAGALLVEHAGSARGGEPDDGAPGGGELRYDPLVSATLTIGAGLGWLASEVVWKDQLAPDDCRWCAANGVDEAVRDGLRWDDLDAAHDASNAVAFLVVPAAGYGLLGLASGRHDKVGNWIVDGLIVTEAAILASAANQLVKFAAGRERPFVHALAEADKPDTERPEDNNLSFYSGHTSLAFSFAAAAGTVARMRRYRWAPLVWGAGGALAVTTGYLRIAADRHWFSDVLTGAVIGAAVGVATPYLLHRPRPGVIEAVNVTPLPGGGAALTMGGRW
jgi:membrane-associated phospholipid phosphatase